MLLRTEPASEGRINAVKAFNQRLAEGKGAYRFPENHIPKRLPQKAGRTIYQEYYLVLDNADNVRGAFILKRQLYKIKNEVKRIAHLELPISEGMVNPEFAHVAFFLYRAAQDIEPRLYTYGMGGINRPLPKSLKALDWFCTLIPFYFKVIKAGSFLKNVKLLRSTKPRRIIMDILAASGLGNLGLMLFNITHKRVPANGCVAENFSTFGDWSDNLWDAYKDEYDFTAARDQSTMNALYPEGERFLKLKILDNSKEIGWVIAVVSQLQGHNYFNNMKTGTILDCWGSKKHYDKIIAVTTAEIKKIGADIIISNQANPVFDSVFKRNGFLKGPSNLGFCFSPEICEDLETGENRNNLALINAHFNRGDGDGALNV